MTELKDCRNSAERMQSVSDLFVTTVKVTIIGSLQLNSTGTSASPMQRMSPRAAAEEKVFFTLRQIFSRSFVSEAIGIKFVLARLPVSNIMCTLL